MLATIGLILVPYLFIYAGRRPSNERTWRHDYRLIAHAKVEGNIVTIYNFRDFSHHSPDSATVRWQTKRFDLNRLAHIDLAMTYWNTTWSGHPIFVFDFGEDGSCAFSIESRLEVGESYDGKRGLFDTYEICYIAASEEDVVRLRTHIRPGEVCYLYRLRTNPEQRRARFLEYIAALNQLAQKPRFYHLVFDNCTTAILKHMLEPPRFDWRIIFNGYLDQYMHERGWIEDGGLNFAELRRQARVDPARLDLGLPYHVAIRQGKVGFEKHIRVHQAE